MMAVFAGILFIIQPYYTWFAADDYCYMHDVQKEGIFSSMWHDYMTWDGRSISLTYPLSRLGLYLQKAWFGPFIGSLLLMATAYIMLLISGFKLPSKKTTFVAVVAAVALLWLASFQFISQTLYWTTGIGYNLDILLLLTAYFVAKRFAKSFGLLVISVPLMFYAGTGSPNGVLALLFLLLLEMIKRAISGEKFHKSIIWQMGLVLTGFIVVVAAPGNANRLTGFNQDNLTHIWTIYFNIKLMFSRMWEYSSPIVWVLLLPAVYAAEMQRNKSEKPGFLKGVFNLFYSHRFLFAALIMFAFFVPLPSLYAPRTHIHFVSMIMLYGLSGVAYLLNSQAEIGGGLGRLALLSVLVVFCAIAGSQAFDSRYVKNQLAAREAKFRENAGKAVILGEGDVIRPPGSRKFEDLGSDTSYFINYCVARHYGLTSVKFLLDSAVVNEKTPKKPTP